MQTHAGETTTVSVVQEGEPNGSYSENGND